MTRTRKRQTGTAAVPALLLAVAGIYLVFRAWVALQSVLSPAAGTRATAVNGEAAMVRTAQARDARVDALGAPGRDPFHLPPRKYVPPPPPRAQEPEPLKSPVVRLLVYDKERPEVLLSLDGRSSDRLHAGETFEGWTVVSITPKSVVVSKDGETRTLSVGN